MSKLISPAASTAASARTIAQIVGIFICVTLTLVAFTMPWWARRYTELWTTEFLYTLALAQAWNLLAGYGGLVSVGQQAFVGLGAYVLVVLALFAGFSPFATVPLAGIVCAIFAIPAAALLFRLKGANFAVGTWVIAEVLRLLISNVNLVGGGAGTSITSTLIGMPVWWRLGGGLWIALFLGAGSTLALYALLRTRLGLALTSVRDSEPAAASLGVFVGRIKWLVYIVAAFWVGMTGALIFITDLRVAPQDAFSIDWSTTTFFVVVIGGIGTVEGPILGTFVFFILRGLLANYGSWYLIALGAVAVFFMVWVPGGIWGLVQRYSGVSIFPVRRRLPTAD